MVAVSSFITACFGAALWWSTRQLWRETKRLATGADAQGKHIETYANAARDSADIAKRQLLIVGAQTDLLEKQKEIMRQQFLATHKPEIIVHDVECIFSPSGDGDLKSYVGASVLCFNVGATEAKDVIARGDIVIVHELPMDVQWPIRANLKEVEIGGKFRVPIVGHVMLSDIPHDVPAFCVGTITYFDGAQGRHETGFCFRLVSGHRSYWNSAQMPEYEYTY